MTCRFPISPLSLWLTKLPRTSTSGNTFYDKFLEVKFLFVFFGPTLGLWKFLGRGLNPSCTKSFNPLHRAGKWTSISTVTWAIGGGFFLFVFFGLFWRPHLRHMEVPRLGVELELQLLAYTTAPAMQDPSHICDLHHQLMAMPILNPLSGTRNWTCILRDTSWVHYCWATMGTLLHSLFKLFIFDYGYSGNFAFSSEWVFVACCGL